MSCHAWTVSLPQPLMVSCLLFSCSRRHNSEDGIVHGDAHAVDDVTSRTLSPEINTTAREANDNDKMPESRVATRDNPQGTHLSKGRPKKHIQNPDKECLSPRTNMAG